MPALEGRLPGYAYPDPPGRCLNTTGEAAWRCPRADWQRVPARRALPPLASRWRPTLVPTVSDPLPGPMPTMLPARFEGSQTITACHPRRACAPWREPSPMRRIAVRFCADPGTRQRSARRCPMMPAMAARQREIRAKRIVDDRMDRRDLRARIEFMEIRGVSRYGNGGSAWRWTPASAAAPGR